MPGCLGICWFSEKQEAGKRQFQTSQVAAILRDCQVFSNEPSVKSPCLMSINRNIDTKILDKKEFKIR